MCNKDLCRSTLSADMSADMLTKKKEEFPVITNNNSITLTKQSLLKFLKKERAWILVIFTGKLALPLVEV